MYKYLVLAAIAACCAAVQQCPANEEYRSCGTACPRTCANRNDGPKPCILLCVPGCFCQKGFFRNAKGVCVQEKDCEGRTHVPLTPTCKQNEEFASCGTACPTTCANRNNPPKVCTMQCVIGCQCKKGFMKNAAGACVKAEQCDDQVVKRQPTQTCKANEEFVTCGTACPVTCANRNNRPKFCTLQCIIGCQCKKGFMKNAAGACVREEQCDDQVAKRQPTKTCGENEVFTQCASTCPRTCANRNQGPIPCNRMCKLNSCECQKGFLRNGAGKCVREEQCESTCTGKNEVLTGCTARCQPMCGVDGPRPCPAICAPGCTCQDGFARDPKGQCVKREECPKAVLADANREPTNHEVFSPCASHCTPTCTNRMPICNRMCVPGMTCEKGYFRNSEGRCVSADEC